MNDEIGGEPLYTISIAAKLVRREPEGADPMHPQTLRMYERLGLVNPHRAGRNRLYSDRDIRRVREIQVLTQQKGVNLAGVEIILQLEETMEKMRGEIVELKKRLGEE